MSGHSEHKAMTLKLIVWRQAAPGKPGRFETYAAKNITEHHSFLEMLDVVNEDLIKEGKPPIVFDHDCREGICGGCSQVINGVPEGDRRQAHRLAQPVVPQGPVLGLEGKIRRSPPPRRRS